MHMVCNRSLAIYIGCVELDSQNAEVHNIHLGVIYD